MMDRELYTSFTGAVFWVIKYAIFYNILYHQSLEGDESLFSFIPLYFCVMVV